MMRVVILALVALLAAGTSVQSADLPIRFTHHASDRLEQRHIRRAWVEQVVRAPDWTEPDPKSETVHRAYGRIAEAKGQVLRVVYTDVPDNRDGRPIHLIITEFFDRAAEKHAPSR
jgi:hypothetical protein